jgi:hypothetical protein
LGFSLGWLTGAKAKKMRLDQITEIAADHLFGRLIRRALMALAVAALGIVAIYYFTVAGTVALETQYGTLNARLIVGIIYTAVAIIIAIWWAVQGKSANFSTPVLSNQRDMQIALLVEAVMLGYALARKGPRAS